MRQLSQVMIQNEEKKNILVFITLVKLTKHLWYLWLKWLCFSDRDDTERTIWDPEGTKNSAVSEQRKPFCNSGLTWQMDLSTDPTYWRNWEKSGQKNTAYITEILQTSCQMVAELSISIALNGKRHDALQGRKRGKLIRWSGTITWLEKILLLSWWQTLILVHLATKLQS